MSFSKSFTELTTQGADNAARLVLKKLSKRIYFSTRESTSDEEMECLQFGICTYQSQHKRVVI